MRRVALVAGVFASLAMARFASAATVATNLGAPWAGYYSGFDSNSRAATSFTTDQAGGLLRSATLRLGVQGTPTLVKFQAFLYDESGGRPGRVLATFTNIPATASPVTSPQDLIFYTSTLLAPDTRYWIAATVYGPGAGGWVMTTGGPGTGAWPIGPSSYSYFGEPFGPPDPSLADQFSLDADRGTSVPSPSVDTRGTWGAIKLLVSGR